MASIISAAAPPSVVLTELRLMLPMALATMSRAAAAGVGVHRAGYHTTSSRRHAPSHLARAGFRVRPVPYAPLHTPRRFITHSVCASNGDKSSTPAGGEDEKAISSRPRFSSRDLMRKALESENVTVPSSIRAELGGWQPVKSAFNAFATAGAMTPKALAWVRATLVSIGWGTMGVLRNPASLGPMASGAWAFIKKEAHHYYLGFRLLGQDVSTCTALLKRVLEGHSLSRRERKLLVRTSSDLFRIIPMSVFLIVPFMELLLPVALWLFPNMLPSQFQSSLKVEEDMKRQLKLRVEMAQFLSETSAEYTRMLSSRAEGSAKKDADELGSLLKKARAGGQLSNAELMEVASLFSDELTLDNISKAQLLAMAGYMGVSTFGTEAMLRNRLRSRMRDLKGDDQQILWEGVDSLSKEELREAAAARGMRAVGLTREGLRTQLEQWLELSVNKSVPVVMLILSRALQIQGSAVASGSPERLLEKSLAALDDSVVTEAVLSGAGEDSKEDTIAMRTLQLQAVQQQTALIQLERDAAKAAEVADEVLGVAEEARAAADAFQADVVAGRATTAEYEPVRQAALEAEAAALEARLFAEAEFCKVSGEGTTVVEEAVRTVESALGEGTVTAGDLSDPARLQQLGKEAGLTPEAMETLQMVASDSAVLKERAALARIKAGRMQEQAATMLAKGRVARRKRAEAAAAEAAGEEVPEEVVSGGTDALGYTAASVQSMLDTMITRLEGQVDSVDLAIGNKMHLLDKDKDGVLSREELEDVALRLLKLKGVEPDDTSALGDVLDLDKDGNITTADLNLIADVLAEAEARAEEDLSFDSAASSGSEAQSDR